MKACYRCDEVRPADQYTPGRNMCKVCRSADTKALYAKNREHHAAVKRAWRQANPDKAKAAVARYQAKYPNARKIQHRKDKYGLLPEDFQAMLAMQDERCAICNVHHSETDRGLHVDHCHKTGAVRALLCGPCNTTLGLLKEDPERFRTSAKYLEHFR